MSEIIWVRLLRNQTDFRKFLWVMAAWQGVNTVLLALVFLLVFGIIHN